MQNLTFVLGFIFKTFSIIMMKEKKNEHLFWIHIHNVFYNYDEKNQEIEHLFWASFILKIISNI